MSENELEYFDEEDAPLFDGKGTAMVVGGIAGAIPLCLLTELLNWGMTGFVSAAVVAGLIAVGAPALAKYLPSGIFEELDWRMLFQSVDELENPAPARPPRVVESEPPAREAPPTDKPFARNDNEPCLHLGAVLHPRAKGLLSMRLGMFGIPGSGKSNGTRVFVEELGKLAGVGVPFVLADTEAEYYALCDAKYLMRPFQGHAGNVSPENAFGFGQQVLDEGLQVVLDLQSYESDDDAALVMVEIIRGLRAWEEAHKNDERATCMFILDEAATWLPQNVKESALSKEEDEQGHTLLAKLQRAVFGTVVRRGRKRGIGFMFATQRPADLDKRATSCDWFILFKQTFPNDLQTYRDLGVDPDIAQALAPGEAFVIDPTGERAAYQFRTSYSPDLSKSPGVESLHFHAQRWQKPVVPPYVPAVETDQDIYRQEISRARVEVSRQSVKSELEDLPMKEPARARADNVDEPVEPTHDDQEDARGKFRLTAEQSAQFRAIYPEYDANKDRVLKKIGANSNYRAHADELIRQYGLDRKRG